MKDGTVSLRQVVETVVDYCGIQRFEFLIYAPEGSNKKEYYGTVK